MWSFKLLGKVQKLSLKKFFFLPNLKLLSKILKINHSVIPGKFHGGPGGGEQNYDQGSYYKDSLVMARKNCKFTSKILGDI